MYNDFRDTNRDRWRFTYLGKDLLRYAEKRQKALHVHEDELRQKIVTVMGNKSVSVTSERVKKLEAEISKTATQAEQFDVYVHEFERHSDKEFQLSIADIVFFGIVGTPAEQCADDW